MAVHKALERVKHAADLDNGNDASKHAELLEAIHQLQVAAETPEEKVTRMRWEFLKAFAVRFAIEYGILQSIAAKAGASVSAAELSKEMGADELLVVRVMRLVTYHGFCEEVEHGVYAANETTKFMASKAWLGAIVHLSHHGLPAVAKVPELIRHNHPHQFPQSADQWSPFQHAFGGDTMFQYLAKNPQRKAIFDDMMEIRKHSKEPKWFEIFPVEQQLADSLRPEQDAVLLVDVGGGKGMDATNFRKRFPELPGKVVVQDLSQTFAGNAAAAEGVDFMPHDFFTEQPIKGARLYFLHAIMHDWQDEKCITILKRLADAMDPGYSTLLVGDLVIPETNVDWLSASFDILMWLFFSGIERTRSQWTGLFDAADLEVVEFWSTPLTKECVIELRVRQNVA